MRCVIKTLDELLRYNQDKQSITFELAPARLLAKGIYTYCLPAPFFNEYLSQIAQLGGWDKVFSGSQHLYYLNDMILTINPDGKQSCHIPKIINDNYFIHPHLIKSNEESLDSILKTSITHLKTITSGKIYSNILPTIDHKLNDEEYDDDYISLKANLRLRVIRTVPISHNQFPPIDSYHFQERHVYRTYTNKTITIHFEIIRPAKCQKKFEELLLPKPESKFTIKIWIKDTKNLTKYLKCFVEDAELEPFNSDS